jgi:hypothetical protein
MPFAGATLCIRDATLITWPIGEYSVWPQGLDRAHNDHAGVDADTNLDSWAALHPQALATAAEIVARGNRGVNRALRMVLVCHWCAEQREDAVAGRLHDVAVIAMDRVDHQLQRRVDDRARLLRVEILHQFGRALIALED